MLVCVHALRRGGDAVTPGCLAEDQYGGLIRAHLKLEQAAPTDKAGIAQWQTAHFLTPPPDEQLSLCHAYPNRIRIKLPLHVRSRIGGPRRRVWYKGLIAFKAAVRLPIDDQVVRWPRRFRDEPHRCPVRQV